MKNNMNADFPVLFIARRMANPFKLETFLSLAGFY